MKIRAHLDLLALGAIAPLLIVSVVAGAVLAVNEQENFKHEALARARSAMKAVDAELHGSIATMQALAASKNLENGDLRAFHEEARRVLATRQPAWRNIGLASVDRKQLLDAIMPYGRQAPFGAGDASFDLAISTRAPVVGDVTARPAVSVPSVRLRVPVVVAGAVRYVLSVPISPASLEKVLAQQELPEGARIGLADRSNKFIARVPAIEVGTPVSEDLRAAAQRSQEGWFLGRALQRAETYALFVTSPSSGWIVTIAIPTSLVEAGAWRTFWLTFFGVLAALCSGLVLAWLMARRIAAPIGELATAARSLQVGGNVGLPTTRHIDEIAHLHDVVYVASLAMHERERLLVRDRETLLEHAQLLDLAHDAIMMRTAAGVIKFWSDGAEKTFGWSKSEAIGRNVIELLDTRFPGPYTDIEATLERDGHWDGVLHHKRKDGVEIMVASRWALRREQPGHGGIVLEIATDITREVEAENSIARLNQQLIEAGRRKDHFLATLAHELRNPLAPISNCVTVLKSEMLGTDKFNWARGVIERQVAQMSRLLDDLLDISRITHGKLALRCEHVSLKQVVDTAVETCRPLLEAGRHELIIDPPVGTATIHVDPVRFAQIVSNLLNNAAKYSDEGKRIWLTVRTLQSDLVITVRDEGIGISADILPRVFDIFTQGEGVAGRAKGGMGIGLALVRALTELHGGAVGVQSGGSGSEFIVKLPRTVVAATVPAAGAHGGNIAPTSFLLADDLADSVDSVAILLREEGHTVHIAYDGEQAFEMAARLRPRVALLDIGMPGLSGHDVARKIRAQPWGRDMLLIALSGWGQFDDRRRSREAGFDHHLVKPLELAQLHEVLRAAFQQPLRAAQS